MPQGAESAQAAWSRFHVVKSPRDSLEGVEAFVYVKKDKLAVILRWQGALFEELREDSEKLLDR